MLQLPIQFTADQPACTVNQVIGYILSVHTMPCSSYPYMQFTADQPPCGVNQVIRYILYSRPADLLYEPGH